MHPTLMTKTTQRYQQTYDLSNCDAEPLRFIRSCQQAAYMLVIYAADLRIKAVSENCAERFGRPAEALIGEDAGAVLGGHAGDTLRRLGEVGDVMSLNPIELEYEREGTYRRENLILHEEGDLLILEIEPRDANFGTTKSLLRIDKAMANIQASMETEDGRMFQTVVEEVKAITGFARVYLYQFDEDYNGDIIAEAKDDGIESYLHLRYPHTDIPKQARELYVSQQIRHITSTRLDDDAYLISDDDAPINLRKAYNRAVSPFHREYLQNINVHATFSVAITVNGKLWGLIASHHYEEKLVDFRLRQMLGLFGRILSGHLALTQTTRYHNSVLRSNLVRARITERMNYHNALLQPLIDENPTLLELVNASSAALVLDDKIVRIGDAPEEMEVRQLIQHVAQRPESIYATHTLHRDLPASTDFTGAPAGMISVRLTQEPGEYIMWFRSEVITTINWGGNPEERKLVRDGKVQLHPEISFAKYSETKRGQSEPWERYQLDNALALRNDIKEVILVKYQEMRQVNSQLVTAYQELESFSYTVSHDLRAPLRSIKGFAEILQEDYMDGMDEFGQTALNTIVSNVNRMNEFINGILAFSRIGHNDISPDIISVDSLVTDVWSNIALTDGVRLELDNQGVEVPGDYTLLSQLFQNLLSNSIKYRREGVDSYVRVNSRVVEGMVEMAISDNGIGFDNKYADKIFAVFNRLVSEEAYEGTGVGLAIAHRIVEKHHGSITADGQLGVGTTFVIKIPQHLSTILAEKD